jgi:P27 family predicted phage terminase small subunit
MTAVRAKGGGRKPKPTALKKAQGNLGRRKLNNAEPRFDVLTDVDPPAWLDDDAKDAWRWYCPQLVRSGVITKADLHNLAVFCASYSRWRTAEQHVAAHGIVIVEASGSMKKNPACTVANEAIRQMIATGALLGLDPSNRSRLIGKDKGGQQENPFANLLR